MPLEHEWNDVDLTQEQIAEHDEFLRTRRTKCVEHEQRLSGMSLSRARCCQARCTASCPDLDTL
eukprot:5390980-Lingulodinium_polyedra.AAC.1